MTRAEVMKTVSEHLLKQGRKSGTPSGGTCLYLYRGPEGTKCALGCLIKDAFYSPELEGKNAGHRDVQAALVLSGVPAAELHSLLDSLQNIHDLCPTDEWPARLAELAGK